MHVAEARGKKKPWLPAYLFVGKDVWQRHIAEEQLWQALSSEGWRCVRWRGGQVSAQLLTEELQTLDLFSLRRILYIEEAEALSKEAQKQLTAHIVRGDASLLLILNASALAPATPLYKAAQEHGAVIANEPLRPREKEQLCEGWLVERAHAAGKQMTSKVASLLRRNVGIEYHLLIQELDKLIAYSGQEASITEAAVAAVTQVVPSDTVWQVSDSLMQNDLQTSLALCHRLLDEGVALIALVRQIRRQFQIAFEVAELSMEEITRRHPQLKDFMIERNKRLAGSYGRQRLPAAICAIDACELAFKNGCDNEKLLVEQLVIFLASGAMPPLKLPQGAIYAL